MCPPRTGTHTSPPPSSPTFALLFSSTKPRHGGHGGAAAGWVQPGAGAKILPPGIVAPNLEQGTFAKEKPRLDPASPKPWEKNGSGPGSGCPKRSSPQTSAAPNLGSPKPRHQPRPLGRLWGRIQPRHIPAAAPAGLRCRQYLQVSPAWSQEAALRAGLLRARMARLGGFLCWFYFYFYFFFQPCVAAAEGLAGRCRSGARERGQER